MPKFVLIAEDNIVMRRIIRIELEEAGLAVCGEAVDGIDAIEKASAFEPDVIILDLAMPRMNGIDAARMLSRICPHAQVVLHTNHAEALRSQSALPDGVTEVVAKGENLVSRILHLVQAA